MRRLPLVALAALSLALQGCAAMDDEATVGSDAQGPARSPLDVDGLAEVNECLRQYAVEMYRTRGGAYEIWGDINRIQDIVDGPCRALFPTGARTDLDAFFAAEVDTRIAECLRNEGVDVTIDPDEGPGIGFEGEPPSDEVVDRCFDRAYTYFSVPPAQRS